MKRFAGSALAAGLLAFGVTTAQAQISESQISEPEVIVVSPQMVAPDVDVAMPPQMAPRPAPLAYAPPLLPPREIYAIARENGYEPIGGLRQNGSVYSITVMNMAGDDGRLIVDGRTGRVRRFTPLYRMSGRYDDDARVAYGEFAPPPGLRGAPRPPGRIANAPHAVPLPKAAPHRVAVAPANPLAAKPAQPPAAPQAVTVGVAKPVEAKIIAPVEMKPVPQIQPTQDMPAVQGLD